MTLEHSTLTVHFHYERPLKTDTRRWQRKFVFSNHILTGQPGIVILRLLAVWFVIKQHVGLLVFVGTQGFVHRKKNEVK